MAQCLIAGVPEVSTHSRLKAAGNLPFCIFADHKVSTHSRLKAAGFTVFDIDIIGGAVSTHSRLKAAGPDTEYKHQ